MAELERVVLEAVEQLQADRGASPPRPNLGSGRQPGQLSPGSCLAAARSRPGQGGREVLFQGHRSGAPPRRPGGHEDPPGRLDVFLGAPGVLAGARQVVLDGRGDDDPPGQADRGRLAHQVEVGLERVPPAAPFQVTVQPGRAGVAADDRLDDHAALP